MVRPSRQQRDRLLLDRHNRWLNRLRSSGLPLWVADIYSFTPLSVSSSIEEGVDKTHRAGSEEKVKLSGATKNGIPAEYYYALLEWKDRNLEKFQSYYGYSSLNSLTPDQLMRLYQEEILNPEDNDLPF